MKRKATLSGKIGKRFNWLHPADRIDVASYILRLIREDRKRHCEECLRVKAAIEKQIEKNSSITSGTIITYGDKKK